MSPVAGPSTQHTSSDDDITMTDSNGQPIPSSAVAADADGAGAGAGADAAGAEGEEGDGSDVPEDEYEIEYIVDHFQESADGQISYFVKWKGYDNSENSWVYESDMGGAQEMIQEYWAKVPKKGIKKMGTKAGGGKKGKRQSSLSASTPSRTVASSSSAAAAAAAAAGESRKRGRRETSINGDTPARKTRKSGVDLAPSRSPTPDDALIDVDNDPTLTRIRSDPTLTEEERQLLEQQHLHAVKLDRLRKRYARIADWDPIVKRVEAVEKMSDNKLRVFVHFESGDRLAFESIVAHHRCPLKLLQFYESNLRFKKRDDAVVDDRVDSFGSSAAANANANRMRGDEDLTALEEYNAAHAEKDQQQQVQGEVQGQDGQAEAQTSAGNGLTEGENASEPVVGAEDEAAAAAAAAGEHDASGTDPHQQQQPQQGEGERAHVGSTSSQIDPANDSQPMEEQEGDEAQGASTLTTELPVAEAEVIGDGTSTTSAAVTAEAVPSEDS